MKSEKFKIYLLNNEKYEGVENYPVISFSPLISSIDLNEVDYLIFTSKNAVRITDSITNKWKKIPSIAIGKATANEIQKLGGIIEYQSNSGYGEKLAKEIDKIYNNKIFLWLRPKKVVTNLNEYIKNNTLKEQVIYETKCSNPKKELKKPSIVIFTSPSTVNCFAKLNNFNNIISIAIGKKTKKVLEKYTENIKTPQTPSINECIKLAKKLNLV